MLNRKEIDKKIMNHLLIKRPQLGRFYLLPKIHNRASNVPGWPVIANNGTTTESITTFLDFQFKTIFPTIPHLLQDTRYFLSRLKKCFEIIENVYLVTFDVVGLYPHIRHEEGLEILKCFLDKREDQSVSSKNPWRLAEIILKQ